MIFTRFSMRSTPLLFWYPQHYHTVVGISRLIPEQLLAGISLPPGV